MTVREFSSQSQAIPAVAEPSSSRSERSLTLLIDGVTINVPELDSEGYKALRANVAKLSQRMPDRLPEEEKLALIREVVREFEAYRAVADKTTRVRQASWRSCSSMSCWPAWELRRHRGARVLWSNRLRS